MSDNINKENMIWIIGSGAIACEYAKVLMALGKPYTVVARSGQNAAALYGLGAIEVVVGGLDAYLQTGPVAPEQAIVAVNLEELSKITKSLLEYGVKSIFVEKPGFLYPEEILSVADCAKRHSANVFLAYNRRFFASTIAAEKIIEEDGGVSSFNFEFTEWGFKIETLPYSKDVFENWMYANSTHVIDLAFFLGGFPKEITCFSTGALSWHKPAVFAGAGISNTGAMFSYQANWNAPGRWGVEILTPLHRLYLRPMETLQVQQKGSITIEPVEIDDELDKKFKPGFYLETKAFINGDTSRLCSIEEQSSHIALYKQIKGEKD